MDEVLAHPLLWREADELTPQLIIDIGLTLTLLQTQATLRQV